MLIYKADSIHYISCTPYLHYYSCNTTITLSTIPSLFLVLSFMLLYFLHYRPYIDNFTATLLLSYPRRYITYF